MILIKIRKNIHMKYNFMLMLNKNLRNKKKILGDSMTNEVIFHIL